MQLTGPKSLVLAIALVVAAAWGVDVALQPRPVSGRSVESSRRERCVDCSNSKIEAALLAYRRAGVVRVGPAVSPEPGDPTVDECADALQRSRLAQSTAIQIITRPCPRCGADGVEALASLMNHEREDGYLQGLANGLETCDRAQLERLSGVLRTGEFAFSVRLAIARSAARCRALVPQGLIRDMLESDLPEAIGYGQVLVAVRAGEFDDWGMDELLRQVVSEPRDPEAASSVHQEQLIRTAVERARIREASGSATATTTKSWIRQTLLLAVRGSDADIDALFRLASSRADTTRDRARFAAAVLRATRR